MGFLDNVFTEEEFDDYRYLEKYILNEAEDDDDNQEDNPDESNFDMPDDDDQGGGEAPNTTQTAPTGPDGEELAEDNPDESNFDMPDDGGEESTPEPAQQDTPAPAAETPAQEPTGAEQPTTDQGEDNLGDDPEESNFDLPDDDTPDAGENPEAGGEEGGDGDNPDDANFDMPDDGGEGGGDNTTPDTGTDTSTSTEDGSTDSGGPDPDQNIRDAEGEIFANLSDKDKINKVNELKTLYEDLYNRIATLHDKVNEIPKDDDLIKVYNFVTDNLADMKEYVYDYMTSTFDNKTYLENMINYKKYLSTLNVINGILEEIRKGLYKADK